MRGYDQLIIKVAIALSMLVVVVGVVLIPKSELFDGGTLDSSSDSTLGSEDANGDFISIPEDGFEAGIGDGVAVGSSSKEGAPPPSTGVAADGSIIPFDGGTERVVTSLGEWDVAVAASAPGDVIRLAATINGRLVYRGANDGGNRTGVDGTANRPIVITANPDVWIDGGSVESHFGGLDLLFVNHVHAVGVRVRNAQFGIRCLQCHGSAERPLRIADSETTNIGYVGIHVGGHLDTHEPSSHVLVEGNLITETGKLEKRFGEGIYLGHGSDEWVDESSNLTVRNNEVAFTTAEGIDIKPGTTDVLVEGNLIHDVSPIDGGSISAHYVSKKANPNPDEVDKVVVRNNRIWNQNRNGAPGASDAAIWVGHGGVEIVDNVIWGFRIHRNSRAVRVRSPQSFGPHKVRIENNVFWVERGWIADGGSPANGSVVAANNLGPGEGVEVPAAESDFVGAVPPIGQAGDADNGSGPGSSFREIEVVPADPTPAPTGGDEEGALAEVPTPPSVVGDGDDHSDQTVSAVPLLRAENGAVQPVPELSGAADAEPYGSPLVPDRPKAPVSEVVVVPLSVDVASEPTDSARVEASSDSKAADPQAESFAVAGPDPAVPPRAGTGGTVGSVDTVDALGDVSNESAGESSDEAFLSPPERLKRHSQSKPGRSSISPAPGGGLAIDTVGADGNESGKGGLARHWPTALVVFVAMGAVFNRRRVLVATA